MEQGKRVEKKQKNKMSKEGIEKKKSIIVKTFITILAIIVIAIVALIANDYIILDNNKRTNLVINNKNVTSNLKNDVLIENNIIYLSKQDIANFFDKYIKTKKQTKLLLLMRKK